MGRLRPHSPTADAMSQQRKKISTACYSCRRRKSKCDGSLPSCLTCQTHHTPCAYNFDRDARKTPSKAYISSLKTRIKSLEDLLDRLLDESDSEARQEIREQIRQERGRHGESAWTDGGRAESTLEGTSSSESPQEFQTEESDVLRDMTNLMSHLHVDKCGSIYSAGATSNLVHTTVQRLSKTPELSASSPSGSPDSSLEGSIQRRSPFFSNESDSLLLTNLERHLIKMYFTWQHPVFYLFSHDKFLRDLEKRSGPCFSPILLAAVLSVGCHFSDLVDDRTGDDYFYQAKTLLAHEIEHPSLTTVQALVLMGIREAGCGRERGSGWLYGGLGFRMGLDLGIHLDSRQLQDLGYLSEEDVQERALTFWGSFVSDKGWTAYLGRPESLPDSNMEEDVYFPIPSFEGPLRLWTPYSDNDYNSNTMQEMNHNASHELGTFRQLCLVVSRLASVLRNVYSKRMLSADSNVSHLHIKLLAWQNELPQYARLSPTASPTVLQMHMFYNTAQILLFRPFIRPGNLTKLSLSTPMSVNPLKICTSSAIAITQLLKQYKARFSLRRYVNMLVHTIFSSATIHILNIAIRKSQREMNDEDGLCTREEATRKLQETMHALNEMGAAWISAHTCLDRIHEWIQKYNLDVRFEGRKGGLPAELDSPIQESLAMKIQDTRRKEPVKSEVISSGEELTVSPLDLMSIDCDDFLGTLHPFDTIFWGGNLTLDQT